MGDEATSGQAFQWALTNGDIDQVKTCINEVNSERGAALSLTVSDSDSDSDTVTVSHSDSVTVSQSLTQLWSVCDCV